MSKYSDLDFFFKKNDLSGDVQLKKDIQAMSQSIKNIILTDTNERFFLPSFGGDLGSEIYEIYDWRTSEVLKENIIAKLNLYEPRIEVNSINITYTDNYTLVIDLEFYPVNNPKDLNTITIQTNLTNK